MKKNEVMKTLVNDSVIKTHTHTHTYIHTHKES